MNGRLATVAELAEQGRALVDLHGQHSHQSLLSAQTQRRPSTVAGTDLASLIAAPDAAGHRRGDRRARWRQPQQSAWMDLLRYQVDELAEANLQDADEDERLEAEEDALTDVAAHREAALQALDALGDDGAAARCRRSRAGWPGGGRSGPRMSASSLGVGFGDIVGELRAALEALDGSRPPEEVPCLAAPARATAEVRRHAGRRHGLRSQGWRG